MYFHLTTISWNYEMTFPDFARRFMAGETFWGPYMEEKLANSFRSLERG